MREYFYLVGETKKAISRDVVGIFKQMTTHIEAYDQYFQLTPIICRSVEYRGHQRSKSHENLTLPKI